MDSNENTAAEQAEPKRKPGRPPKVRDETEAVQTVAETNVTYTPGPGDNPEVKWMGHVFHANVPHPVRRADLIEKARANRFFHVGEFDPRVHMYREEIPAPKTAEAYRRWAVEWMKKVPNVEAACEKWANEARMRAQLEVGFDDYKYISDFFQPILSELIKKEEEPRQVRDKITRNGEFADLMLQVNRVGEAA